MSFSVVSGLIKQNRAPLRRKKVEIRRLLRVSRARERDFSTYIRHSLCLFSLPALPITKFLHLLLQIPDNI